MGNQLSNDLLKEVSDKLNDLSTSVDVNVFLRDLTKFQATLSSFAPSKSVNKLEEIGKNYLSQYLKQKTKSSSKDARTREMNLMLDAMRSGYEEFDDLVSHESFSTTESASLIQPADIQSSILGPLKRDYSITVVILIAFALNSKKQISSIDLLNMMPQISDGNDCMPQLLEVTMLYIQKSESISLLNEFYEIVKKMAPLYLCNMDSSHQITIDIAFSSLADKINGMLNVTKSVETTCLLLKCLLRMGINTGCIEYLMLANNKLMEMTEDVDLEEETQCLMSISWNKELCHNTLSKKLKEIIIKDDIKITESKVKDPIFMIADKEFLYFCTNSVGIAKLSEGRKTECYLSNKNALDSIASGTTILGFISVKRFFGLLYINSNKNYAIKQLNKEKCELELSERVICNEELPKGYILSKSYGCCWENRIYIVKVMKSDKYESEKAKEYLCNVSSFKIYSGNEIKCTNKYSFSLKGDMPMHIVATSASLLTIYASKDLKIIDLESGEEIISDSFSGKKIKGIYAHGPTKKIYTCDSKLKITTYSTASIPGGVMDLLKKHNSFDYKQLEKQNNKIYNSKLLQWKSRTAVKPPTATHPPKYYIRQIIKSIYKNSLIGSEYYQLMDPTEVENVFKLYKFALGIHLTTDSLNLCIDQLQKHLPSKDSKIEDFLTFTMIMQILASHIQNLQRCGISNLSDIISEKSETILKDIAMKMLNQELIKPPLTIKIGFDEVYQIYCQKFISTIIHLVITDIDSLVSTLQIEISKIGYKNKPLIIAVIKCLKKKKILTELLTMKNRSSLKKLLEIIFSLNIESFKQKLNEEVHIDNDIFYKEVTKLYSKFIAFSLQNMG